MILLDPNARLVCQHCDGMVVHDETKVVGCLCDPDSPSWVGVMRDGRVLAMSNSDYEICSEPKNL